LRDSLKSCLTQRRKDGIKDIGQPKPGMRTIFYSVWRFVAVLLLAGLAWSAHAVELTVGDSVPVFSAKDQFGKDFKFSPGLHFLLLGFDMHSSKEATQKLGDLGAGWLEQHSAAYVMDIHSMPAIITRMFALPKMRKCPARIILCEDEKTLAPFPRQTERITVLFLTTDGKLKEIRYWDPENQNIADWLKK